MKNEVYLHGQILGTHSFLLRGEFPQPDSYSEINERYFLPGGETGTAATVLSSLGVQVKMDGTCAEVFSRYEELVQLGLDVPQITYVAAALKKQGIDIGRDIYTVKYAASCVLEKMAKYSGGENK